jgi:threo-3-hydroxy-L-aspartate ammonia-lyase
MRTEGSEEIIIANAAKRLLGFIYRTPILYSSFLNEKLGHKFFFKAEPLQKIGAFKARGALNCLLRLKEENKLPQKIACFSSGNHAQGVAYAAKTLGLETTILMPKYASTLKKQAAQSYGANIVITEDRKEAEILVESYINNGAYFIHPYANPYVIEGQGTACFEALEDLDLPIDLISAPCGGGGLLSGTYLAAQELSPESKVIGSEPILANDAAISLRTGEIHNFNHSPKTICDGVMTLHISEITFQYLKKLDDFLELEEEKIIYWTQWLIHLLKLNLEPSSALAMAAAVKHLKKQNYTRPQNILIILSGGNISEDKQRLIWERDYLSLPPNI